MPLASSRRCIEWVDAHYKQLGSYPTLSSGASADEEARARCKRTIDAYPNPEIAETERAIAGVEKKLGESADRLVVLHGRVGDARAPGVSATVKEEAAAELEAANAARAALVEERDALRAKLTRIRKDPISIAAVPRRSAGSTDPLAADQWLRT